jgi:1,4-dihydroxy-2-naphthoyl-CoA synthase
MAIRIGRQSDLVKGRLLHPTERTPFMTDNILTEVDQGVGTITLNRRERRNALSVAMFTEMSDTLDSWAYDDDVAAFVEAVLYSVHRRIEMDVITF